MKAIAECNDWRMKGDPPLPPIPPWTPYQLRHQAATEIGEQFDPVHAAATLGHAGMASIDVYLDQLVRKAAKVAAEMG